MSTETQYEFDEAILKPAEGEVVCPAYTTPLHEVKFYEYCLSHDVVSYLPLRKTLKLHNVRSATGKGYNYSKEVFRPMFPAYVFVKAPREQLRRLFESKLITRIIPATNQAELLDDLRLVRKVELVGLDQELEFNPDLAVGDYFRIDSGIWQGATGWLTKKDARFKWTVQIKFAEQFITTYIDPSKFKMERITR